MKLLGLTPWRIFLIFWAAFCTTVSFALFGYHWAIVACHVTEYVAAGVGAAAFLAAFVLRGWQKWQERKRGDAR